MLGSCVNKPCYLVSLNGVQLMLDCALDFSTVLNFLPLGLVQSDKMASLPAWTGGTTLANVLAAPDTADQIAQLQAQNELKESTIQVSTSQQDRHKSKFFIRNMFLTEGSK